MKIRILKQYWTLAVLSLVWVLAGCGGGGSGSVPQTPAPTAAPVSVAVSVSPSTATLVQGMTLQFNATVTGSANTVVTWSVQESAGGSISNAGLYTAPSADGIFRVIAASQADPSKFATAFVTVVATPEGLFFSAGDMATARTEHTATRLRNGRVLVAGGGNGSGVLSSAELFDPAGGTFSPTGAMNQPRGSHTATLLEDGTVLITGGRGPEGRVALAEIYDPVSGTFSPSGNLLVARHGHTATPLANGAVLIAGGYGDNFLPLGTAEIYDPATRTFASTGLLREARADHSASLLPDGRVLLAGGVVDDTSTATSGAELYEPSTGMFFVTGSMEFPRALFVAAVTDGKVLVAGGLPFIDDFVQTTLAAAELYDPALGIFVLVEAMSEARESFAGVTLQDGTVLVTGGFGLMGVLSGAELHLPETQTFEPTGRLVQARLGHTATLLTDGRVLVTGGWNKDGIGVSTAELYTPVPKGN